MKLANAKLCLNCDEVYESNRLVDTNGYCPRCLEKHAIMLKDYMPILHNYVAEALANKKEAINGITNTP